MRNFIDILESIGSTFYHVTPTANLGSIMKHGLQPQVGERSRSMDDEAGIYLFASRDDAEDAVMNWLGDQFGDEPLTLLRVTIPAGAYVRQAFEVLYRETISPDRIEMLSEI